MRWPRSILAAVVVIAVGSISACGASRPVPPIEAPPGKSWNLIYDVNFDGSSLEESKLTPCFDWNYGDCTSTFNHGKEHYLPSQVRLSDGVAHLVAEPLDPAYNDSACFEGQCTYKSGLVSTARPDVSGKYLFTFTYGYVEARMKLPRSPGMFSAFWMVPAVTDNKYNYEIDIMENLGGQPDLIHQTFQYDDRKSKYVVSDGQNTNGKCPMVDYSNDFHTYGVNWQPDHVAFYIDGTECGRFAATAARQIPNVPMQIIANLMVDNDWQRETGRLLPSQSTVDQLDIDYLRVWQAS